jgi:DNA-directed RNA polymerase II subunit RPB1
MPFGHNQHEVRPSRIIGIQFSIMSPEEIRRNSVVHVTNRNTYSNGKPDVNGLFDPRMGTLENGTACPTDGLTNDETPGYFGHVELARPVIHINHLKEIVKICKCVCFKCSKLLINKNDYKHIIDWTASKRWDYVSGLTANVRRCGEKTNDGCGCRQPSKIKVLGIATIMGYWDNLSATNQPAVEVEYTPQMILKIFRRISDEDVRFMGFHPKWSRPEWMICEVLPIAPPQVRPSVKHDAQQRSEDDLTHIYSKLLKTNDDLKKRIASSPDPDKDAIVRSMTTLLQYFTAMIANNKVKGSEPISQRSGRPYQCIMGRLNGKNGRIRGNLMGKRVNYSARSVITGDPNLSIRELGVPMKIASNITKPEIVNDRNRDFLMQLVRNSATKTYPAATSIDKKGRKINLRNFDVSMLTLENGDVVHRQMMDGDTVLFNRQPSLHKMSMMGHVVKVMSVGDTFRMNVGDTKPYNADFDGDEMNMHMPQSASAEIELSHLSAIPHQLISPTNNSPIIGIYQDSLLGCFLYTKTTSDTLDGKIDLRRAMNLLAMYNHIDYTMFENPTQKWKDGSMPRVAILSQIMPPITYKAKTGLFDGDKEDAKTSNHIVEINRGIYMRGRIDGSVKNIIHRIHNDLGNMHACNFIDNLQNVITEYMKTHSFSVGISDLMADTTTAQKIREVIHAKKMEVKQIIDEVHLGIFKNNTADSNMTEFENRINDTLIEAMNEAGKTGRANLSSDNRFVTIVNSGSKGKVVNISQMISCLGQQNVEGKRIQYGFDSRTLPHYSKYDDSPNSRGFIENSYISGLTAQELFFHAMGGRIGLIDTAVKTSQTGYIQRKLIKGLEDLKVEYDGTVRNNKNKIIQFSYGEDGFETTRVEKQSIPLVKMTVEDIYTHYDVFYANTQSATVREMMLPSIVSRYRSERNTTYNKMEKIISMMIQRRDEVVEYIFANKSEDSVLTPVNIPALMSMIHGQLNLSNKILLNNTPLDMLNMCQETYNQIKSQFPHNPPTALFETLYWFYLSPRELMQRRFHTDALQTLLDTIVLKYKQAIVHPGEMVGVVAGQSIGEPTTQLTLNTFHTAGVASKSNVTRGVPRIEELLRLTKNPKNPSLTVHLKPVDEQYQERAIHYSKMMEYTKLEDLVKSVQIWFDPNDENSRIVEDRIFLQQYKMFERMMEDCGGGGSNTSALVTPSKWVIRMELDQSKLLDKNITMDDVHFALNNSSYGDSIECVYSDFNSDKLIFRVRMLQNMSKNKRKPQDLDPMDDLCHLKHFQDSLLSNIVLRGLDNIVKVLPRKLQNMAVKEDGKYVNKPVWILDTTGTNLMSALSLDYIDKTRTYSNDVKEIYDVLGIEAARQILLAEFNEVMEFAGVSINYHHLSVLCDRMTSTKDMVSIYRTGIIGDDIGPISKSTFEVQTEVLLEAARRGEYDHMRGVSACVMTGQYGYYGTNAFQVVADPEEWARLSREASASDVAAEDMARVKAEKERIAGLTKSASEVCDNVEMELLKMELSGCGDTVEIRNNLQKAPEYKLCEDMSYQIEL